MAPTAPTRWRPPVPGRAGHPPPPRAPAARTPSGRAQGNARRDAAAAPRAAYVCAALEATSDSISLSFSLSFSTNWLRSFCRTARRRAPHPTTGAEIAPRTGDRRGGGGGGEGRRGTGWLTRSYAVMCARRYDYDEMLVWGRPQGLFRGWGAGTWWEGGRGGRLRGRKGGACTGARGAGAPPAWVGHGRAGQRGERLAWVGVCVGGGAPGWPTRCLSVTDRDWPRRLL